MRLFANKENIPKEIFSAYLRGGRMWPQMRWANNILIMDAILTSKHYGFSNTSDWNRFSQTTFSSQQLLCVDEVMKRDHLKASISPAQPIDNQKLIFEWEKTKIGVYKTFLSFKKNTLENYLNEDSENEITTEIFNMRNFQFSVQNSEYQSLTEVTSCAKKTISMTTDLANIFRITYHPIKNREVFFTKESIKQLFGKYGISPSFVKACPNVLREEIKCTIFEIIYQNVSKISQGECCWVIYDRNWIDHYRSENFLRRMK